MYGGVMARRCLLNSGNSHQENEKMVKKKILTVSLP